MENENSREQIILMREGSYSNVRWRQYLVVESERVAIIDMVPALYGWNFGKVTVQDGDAWRGMDASAIVAWKQRADDRSVVAKIAGADREKLLMLADG